MNVCRMCLFLQSQDFQRHTEHLINALYSSSQHAAQQLHKVDSHLGQSLATMQGIDPALSQVAATQSQQLEMAGESLKGMEVLQNDSHSVHTHLEYALQNQVSAPMRLYAVFCRTWVGKCTGVA